MLVDTPVNTRDELRPFNWMVNSQATPGKWHLSIQETSNCEHIFDVVGQTVVISSLALKLVGPLIRGKFTAKYRYCVNRNLGLASAKDRTFISISCGSELFFLALVF